MMGLQDLIITPLYLISLILLGFWVRKFVPHNIKRYFIPALIFKLLGAICLGLIYQFYYTGGDTFNYFLHGSRWIWKAFQEDPMLGLSILLEEGGERVYETYEYTQHIWYYKSKSSFFIVRLTAFFDLLTFHTYSATALFFAVFSFSGSWMLFDKLSSIYKQINRGHMAIALLFIPSTIFWGSGILKDTITYGSVCWLTWSLVNIIESGRHKWQSILIAILASWLIYKIKIYILICYLPLVLIWVYWKQIRVINSFGLKVIFIPVLGIVFMVVGYYTVDQVSSDNDRYSMDKVLKSAAITAYDIRYGWGARSNGDGGYDIGLPDGTLVGTLRLMPAAINVSIFRPYLWEVKNPLMLLASLESSLILVFFIWASFRGGFFVILKDPFLIFCLAFSILFAFAIGVSTFNFGTLMRYKIPMLPFMAFVLAAMFSATKKYNRNS
ncbi:MAG: hypothetical protein ABJG41_00510 [Cyclobacteriaceae bacterium]